MARFSAAAAVVRSSKAGMPRTSAEHTAPPCVLLIEPARSSASRSRRIVLSETASVLTSSSSVANPRRAIKSRSWRRRVSASIAPFASEIVASRQ
jgi:hypothetical protein